MKFNNLSENLLNYKFVLYSFLIMLLAFILFMLYKFSSQNDPWILGDWLINYQDGGFKRRGISGSMFFLLQDFTHFKLQTLVFLLQSVFYVVFIFLILKLLYNKIISPVFLTLLLSPLAFLFYINDIEIIGRKEILLLCLFSYYIILITKSRLTIRKEILIMSILSLLVFFHELMFFYTPYFVAAYYLYSKKTFTINRSIIYLLCTLIPAILLFVFGGNLNNGQSFDILLKRGVEISRGILSWSNNSFQFITQYFLAYLLYAVTFTITTIHLLYYLFKINKILLIYLYLFMIIFSIPLFVAAIDWGRWLHIHFLLMLILLSAQLKESKSWKDSKMSFEKVNIKVVAMLPLMFIWKTNHFYMGFAFNDLIVMFIKKIGLSIGII